MLSIRPLDSGNQFATKTPGRLRNPPPPSTVLKENASRNGPLNKGTTKINRTVYPSTPAPKGYSLQESTGTGMKPTTSTRLFALVDKTNKTPFVLRNQFPATPVPSGKLNLGFTPHPSTLLDAPGSVLRPSSTRKSLRVPRSSSKSFETPDTNGRRPHWDVSFNDGLDEDVSMEVPGSSEAIAEEIEVDEDDPTELEVMQPPSKEEPPYDPGFEMPDYAELGAALMAFSKRPTIWNEWIIDWDAIEPVELCEVKPSKETPDFDSPFPEEEATSQPRAVRPTTKQTSVARGPVGSTNKAGTASRTTTTSRTATIVASRPSTRVSAAPTRTVKPVVGKPVGTVPKVARPVASRTLTSAVKGGRPTLPAPPKEPVWILDSISSSVLDDDFRFEL